MNISYLGDFSETWHTEAHVASDAEALGHTVRRNKYSPEADVVIMQGNVPIGDDWIAQAEADGAKTGSYHLDLYVGLPRQRLVGSEPMWRTGHVFTADGDPGTAKFMADRGVHHHWLPPACVSHECIPGEWQAEHDVDVVFVGSDSNSYHRQWVWRRQLLSVLHRRYGSRFRQYGSPLIRDLALNDLYATARVVVGDSLCLPGHSRYWSDRLTETLGRGGFLLFPRIDGLEEQGFTDHEHLRLYDVGDIDHVCTLIDYYLDHPDQARNMADWGQRFVADFHTYAHRVDEMLAVMCA